MIGLRLSWFALEAVLLGLFFLSGSAVPLAMALGLLLVVLASLPVNLLVRRRLRMKLQLPVNLAKGKPGAAQVLLDNPTCWPVPRIVCRLRVENRLNGDSRTLRLHTFSLPRRTGRLELDLGSDCCGRLHVTVERIWLCDCFGLLAVTAKPGVGRSATVQPDTFQQTLHLALHASRADDADQYAPNRPGSDRSEVFQIREYAEGDSPRQIHWKLSGKLDRLIVKDPSLPVLRSVLVFWERTGDTGSRTRTDAQAEVVATICRSLLQAEIPFTLGWNDTAQQKLMLQPVESLDEFIGILPRLLTARGQTDGIPGGELLVQALGDQVYSHIIYLGERISDAVGVLQAQSHVTLLACGAQAPGEALLFDETNYQTQLAQLDL